MVTNISNQYFKQPQQPQQPQVKNKTIDKGLTYLSYGVLVPASGFVGGKVANKQYQKNKQALSDLVSKQGHEPLDDKCFNFRDRVMATFSDLVLNEKEGHPVDMPNCLLVVGDDPKYCERMIDWIGKTSNADYKTIKNGDNILAHLEQYEENYQKTKNRTLLHVKDMESLIDHHKSEDWVVESMKDIMSAAAEDYHSTLIFSSTHPETLDSIALQPHRVKKIKTADIKTPKDMDIEDAKVRLMDSQNAKNTPISTINDLLLVAKADDSLKLSWEHTPEQLEKAENVITNTFNKNEDKHYLKMYNIAKDNLV